LLRSAKAAVPGVGVEAVQAGFLLGCEDVEGEVVPALQFLQLAAGRRLDHCDLTAVEGEHDIGRFRMRALLSDRPRRRLSDKLKTYQPSGFWRLRAAEDRPEPEQVGVIRVGHMVPG
jgi:hypothetical protein